MWVNELNLNCYITCKLKYEDTFVQVHSVNIERIKNFFKSSNIKREKKLEKETILVTVIL